MPSGWDVYSIVFISAFLALGIPATLAVISYLISPNHAKIKGRQPQASGGYNPALADATRANVTELGPRMNARFFLSANAALVLIALLLILVPCSGMLQPGVGREGVLRGLVAIVTVAGFAAIGLLYAARKSDLGWLRSFHSKREPQSPALKPEGGP
jgi:NADH:ubiquinone oxidoreductase subunit 3 (subunit A)